MTLGGARAGDQGRLIVAVKVDFVIPVADLFALFKLVDDIGIAGCCE
jgi:hypothetical protein